jgi:hypothetical protein
MLDINEKEYRSVKNYLPAKANSKRKYQVRNIKKKLFLLKLNRRMPKEI